MLFSLRIVAFYDSETLLIKPSFFPIDFVVFCADNDSMISHVATTRPRSWTYSVVLLLLDH